MMKVQKNSNESQLPDSSSSTINTVQREKVKELERLLSRHSSLFDGIRDTSKRIEELILDVYLLEKPVTSFTLDDPEKADKLALELEKFFFVGTIAHGSTNIELYIARFEHFIKVIMELNGLSDEVADVSGLFYGYSLSRIAEYCIQDRLKDFDLFKL